MLHPKLELDFIYSTTKAGQPVIDSHQDLIGSINLKFTNTVNTAVDVVFLCLGHGNSSNFLNSYKFADHTVIIDLSNDFRLQADAKFDGRNFIYGLPELHKYQIKTANAIANPGCFATAIQLALLPLASQNAITDKVHINATTGSTGAGGKLQASTGFSWRNNNLSWYKPFTHQHLAEINQSLFNDSSNQNLLFLANRGNFTRGIFVTAYTQYNQDLATAIELYTNYYASARFTHISQKEISLKTVVNTNNCILHLHKHNDMLLITSIIDNLIKGAVGQAIQNYNLINNWQQDLGLQLKPSIF